MDACMHYIFIHDIYTFYPQEVYNMKKKNPSYQKVIFNNDEIMVQE